MSDKTSNQILLTNVRLSYAYLDKPYEAKDGKKTFCTNAVFATDHPQVQALKDLQKRVATDFWKDKVGDMLQSLAAKDKLVLHRGDVSKPGVDVYKGKLFISANSKVRPTIIDGNRNPLVSTDPNFPYSGCWANLIVDVWAMSNEWGQRVNAQLMGVQFLRHDERLSGGGRTAAPDEFGIVATDADGAAPSSADSSGAGLI